MKGKQIAASWLPSCLWVWHRSQKEKIPCRKAYVILLTYGCFGHILRVSSYSHTALLWGQKSHTYLTTSLEEADTEWHVQHVLVYPSSESRHLSLELSWQPYHHTYFQWAHRWAHLKGLFVSKEHWAHRLPGSPLRFRYTSKRSFSLNYFAVTLYSNYQVNTYSSEKSWNC